MSASLNDRPSKVEVVDESVTVIAGASLSNGLPAGGVANDLLVKSSATNYDAAWSDAPIVDSITLDTTAAETLAAVGQTAWDDTAGSAATLLKGGNVTAIMGQTIYQRVVNETGSQLTKGQVVYLTGASGQKVTVALAQADGDPTSSKTFGVVAETIPHSQQGFVMTEGLLQGFATNLLTEGAIVWLSPTTPGGMTTTKPTAPDHTVMVGICVKSGSGTSGSILVKVQNGYELDELHDVAYTGTPATGDVLTRTAGGLWTNAAPAASGAPVGAQYVTLATDGTLTSERVLTAGTGITVTDGGAGAAVTVATSAILPTIIDAAGDLIVGTAADTAARLAVGSNDAVLTAASGATGGMRWTTPFAPSIVTWPADKDWTWRIGNLSVALTADRIVFLGFVCTRSQTISALIANCSAGVASTSILMGVYSANTDGSPNALLRSGSASAATTGGKTVSLSPSLALSAGTTYFLAAMATGGTPSFYGGDANNGTYGSIGPLSTDNLARGSIWFKTATVSGVLDATITGATFGFTGVTKPNIGVTVASAP